MADEQRIRLALEILGAEGVTDLKNRLDGLNAEGGELAAALGRGEISSAEFDAEMKRVAATARGLESALRSLDAAADGVDVRTKKASQGVAGFGQATLQTGRVVQDFAQGGIGGILNNIEGLTQSLGLGSGLAGVLTIVGVAAYALGPQLKALAESLLPEKPKAFGDELKTLGDRVKELEGKKVLIPIEARELDEAKEKLEALKRALAEYEAQKHQQTVSEAESGKSVQEALNESPEGAQAIEGRAVTGLYRDARANSQSLKKAQEDKARAEDLALRATDPAEAVGLGKVLADAERRIQETERNLQVEARATYGTILDRAKKGSGANQAQAQRQLTGLTGLDFYSPEEIRSGKEMEAAEKQFDDELKASLDAKKKAADAAKKAKDALTDALNAQGVSNEKDGKTKQDAQDDKDKALVDMLNAQGVSNEKDGKDKQDAQEKADKAEQKRIEATVGKDYQHRYELALATNSAAIATGQGGLDPEALKAQLKNEMMLMLRQRRASTDAAKGAIASITGKGDEDLGRKAADAAAGGLNIAGQTLMIQRELIGEYERISQMQREMRREQVDQGKQLRAAKASQRDGNRRR